MARYIDADELYCRIKTHTNPYGKPTLDYESGVKVLDMIKQSPTADVVEVVRCKDCRHGSKCTDEYYTCKVDHRLAHDEDDFCSYGERKE